METEAQWAQACARDGYSFHQKKAHPDQFTTELELLTLILSPRQHRQNEGGGAVLPCEASTAALPRSAVMNVIPQFWGADL